MFMCFTKEFYRQCQQTKHKALQDEKKIFFDDYEL